MKGEEEIKKRLESRRENYLKYNENMDIPNISYLIGYITALEWVLSNDRIRD